MTDKTAGISLMRAMGVCFLSACCGFGWKGDLGSVMNCLGSFGLGWFYWCTGFLGWVFMGWVKGVDSVVIWGFSLYETTVLVLLGVGKGAWSSIV